MGSVGPLIIQKKRKRKPTHRRSPSAIRDPPLTAHRSPLTAHRSPLTAHRSPLTAHRSPTHHPPTTQASWPIDSWHAFCFAVKDPRSPVQLGVFDYTTGLIPGAANKKVQRVSNRFELNHFFQNVIRLFDPRFACILKLYCRHNISCRFTTPTRTDSKWLLLTLTNYSNTDSY